MNPETDYKKIFLPYLKEIGKGSHQLTTEDFLSAYIKTFLDYQKEKRRIDVRYEAALNTNTSLPSKESYTVEEIANFYDRSREVEKEIEECEEQLDLLKKVRQECKKKIGEYLPEGLVLKWTSEKGDVYNIEHLPKEYAAANIPNIKVTEVE